MFSSVCQKIFIIILFALIAAFIMPAGKVAEADPERGGPRIPALSALRAYAAEDSFMRTSAFNVDVTVMEDNTFYVTERISVEFLEASRGIIRNIPYKGEAVSKVDGEVVRQDARMQIKVIGTGSDPYTVSRSGGEVAIRIGDPKEYFIGDHEYIIRYRLKLNDDRIKEYDSIYLNVIPAGWPTDIDAARVNITFPRDTDVSKAEFIGKKNGKTSTNVMDVQELRANPDGTCTLSATSKRPIRYQEGLTFRLVLPEGYFVSNRIFFLTESMFWVVIFAAPLICFLLWFFFGRGRPIVETVEFRAPDGLTPAEVGLLWDGKLNDRDMSAMFLYWANEGKLSIEEFGQDDIILRRTDIPDMDSKPFERKMFSRIFSLEDTVYGKLNAPTIGTATNNAKKDLYNEYNFNRKKKLYDERSLNMRAIAFALVLLPVIFNAIYAVDAGRSSYNESGFAAIALFVFTVFRQASPTLVNLLSGADTAPALISGALKAPAVIIGINVILFCGLFMFNMPVQALFTVASTVLCLMFAALTRKKTEYYTLLLGRIRGFANFIRAAELDRINMLVKDDPAYFFDILPYAWVMGLTKEWASRFDKLGQAVDPPYWYGGYDPGAAFSYVYLTDALSRSADKLEAAFSAGADPFSGGGSGGSGGGSGGGGFSGGGFGGGGGGRW